MAEPGFGIFSRLTSGVFLIVDGEGTIVQASSNAQQLFGVDVSIVGRKIFDLATAEHATRVRQCLLQALQSGEPTPGSFEVVTSSGERRAIRWSGARFGFPERLALFHCRSALDSRFAALNREVHALNLEVARRREAEAELRTITQRLESILASAPEGIFGVDLEGRISFCNDAALSALGYDAAEDLVGARTLDVFPVSLVGNVLADGGPAKAGRGELGGRRELVPRRDGCSIPVEYRVSPIRRQGERVGLVVTFRDITTRIAAEERARRFEEKVQQGQKLESLGVLAGGIAHDFNNLLTGIIGNTDLALQRIPATETSVRQCLDDSLCAARRAGELCHQMLAYSGRARLHVGDVDLSALTAEMAQLVKASISKKVKLRQELAPDLPAIRGDASQLRQVVMNLIINASDALGDENGTVTISTSAKRFDEGRVCSTLSDGFLAAGDYVSLEVSDDGIGMDPQTIEKIFDPFFSTKETGHGLGLAAVLGIVRGHHGAIDIESEPGRGTWIRLLFPARGPCRVASVEGSRTRDREVRKRTATVLVVDDESMVRALAIRILQDVGFETIPAADGEEALAIYRERGDEIGVVLLDMTMPKLDGAQTLRALQTLDPSVKVILTSGFTEYDLERELEPGSIQFLSKPYRPEGLLESLDALLES